MAGALWAIINPILLIRVFWYVAAYGLRISIQEETLFLLFMFAAIEPIAARLKWAFAVR